MASSLSALLRGMRIPLLLLILIQVPASADNQGREVEVIPATKWFYRKAERGNKLIRKLLDAAKPTIGVTYQ
ncbi:MAG TPA: hypothetical protein DIV79_13930 [Opitutae bacterium]|nr:hypothetical protein [Opitutaceae bacterium]HCR31107.1 hypothetical protein [Opitutae bacterium]